MSLKKSEIKKMVRQAIDEKRWLIRTSNDGEAYNGFRWNGIGEWTEAPDWSPEPVCGGGLHGQGAVASGELVVNRRGRVEFCIVDGPQVAIGHKQKSPRAMILLIDDLSKVKGLSVGGSLDLSGCTGLTSLPEGLSVGESLYLSGCTGLTSLPEGLSVGGSLDLSGCTGLTSLPEGLERKAFR